MKNPPTRERDPLFYKIMTSEADNAATIFLYGYIGEEWSWDDTKGWTMTGATDIEFVKELNALAERYATIHVRINSPGGDIMHGNAIQTAIRGCKAEVHTWVDGIAASMAADIWLCGHRRHMARNGLVMIHQAWSFCMGHEQDMRDCADALAKMTGAIIIATAASTGISEDEIRARYYADYKDHWLNYADALADGLITDPEEDYQVADNPQALANMTWKQLVTHFEKQSDPEAPGLMARIGAAYRKTVQRLANVGSKSITSQPDATMTADELKKSLADGTLKLEDVQAIVAELAPATTDDGATPATPAEPEEPQYVKDLRAQMATLQGDLAKLAAAPGAAKSIPGAPDKDLPTPDAEPTVFKALDDFNTAAAAAAKENDTLRFQAGVRQ